MKNFTMQLSYRKGKKDHTFMGGCNLSTGVMVSNPDFIAGLTQAEEQLSRILEDNHQLGGTLRLGANMTKEELAKRLEAQQAAMIFYHLEHWH